MLHHAPIPFPGLILEGLTRARRASARMRVGSVDVDGFTIPYLEAGRGPVVVLLHGLGDRKDSFVDVAKALTARHRVILPDLPGFGDASKPRRFRYTVGNLAALMAATFDRLGLDRFHLGGNSLGGAIATQYAIDHPHRVRSLFLANAAGVDMPEPSEMMELIEAGHNPFRVTSDEEFERFMLLSMGKVPPLPRALVAAMARESEANSPMRERVFIDVAEEELDLTPELHRVETPTLVLWGDRDRMLHPSMADVFHRGIAGSEKVVLPGVGHLPQYERPRKTGSVLADFLLDVGQR